MLTSVRDARVGFMERFKMTLILEDLEHRIHERERRELCPKDP